MIKRFEVTGLGARTKPIRIDFNEDINVLTGRNGSGKTTILKLMWYILSGNIGHATREVPFDTVILETDHYIIAVERKQDNESHIEIKMGDQQLVFDDNFDSDIGPFIDADSEASNYIKDIGGSVFFPTFRRIEGGFSIGTSNRPLGPLGSPTSRSRSEIEEGLVTLSRRMTVAKHTFVTAISTVDVSNLLLTNYTEMIGNSNSIQQRVSREVIDKIVDYKRISSDSTQFNLVSAENTIDNIQRMVEDATREREAVTAPFEAVRSVVEKVLRRSGIKFSARLSFGDATNAISSDRLSAGEKQMLSFICYNAFNTESVIFIDEPELSLHVDWQRRLFPTLQDQGSGNQFIIATHSPFIYSKYPDKEILVGDDRGDENEEID